MKLTASTLALLPLALAAPSPSDHGFSSMHARSVEARQLATSNTENGLGAGQACKAMTVIFARGTTEQGNVGTLAGPPFFQALSTMVGGDANLAVQGVNYPADIPGFLAGGDKQGSATMAQLVQQAMTSCPQTKLVMAGYSQGGQLVHNAASMLSASQTAFVNSGISTTLSSLSCLGLRD